MSTFVILVIASYLMGNINPATIIARLNGIDIKNAGSGNPGTTNVMRTMGMKLAVVTLIVDILKGSIPVLAGFYISSDYIKPAEIASILNATGMQGNQHAFVAGACMLAAVIGHIFPVFHGFKGGKGIATSIGAVYVLDFRMGLLYIVAILLPAMITRKMSIGSIFGACCLPIMFYFYRREIWVMALILAVIMIIKHIGNIRRLVKGEEPNMLNIR